jgi:hypothetical protein
MWRSETACWEDVEWDSIWVICALRVVIFSSYMSYLSKMGKVPVAMGLILILELLKELGDVIFESEEFVIE